MEKTEKRKLVIELFLLSVVSLFVELLIIRVLSSDFRSLAVFKTFPLVVCFVGLGAGLSLGKDKAFANTAFALYMFVCISRFLLAFGFGLWLFPATNVYQWSNLVGDCGPYFIAYVGAFLIGLTTLFVAPFALCYCLGARIGVLFNSLPALEAYCINIGGALAGSILFTILSFFCLPPWAFLLVPCAVIFAFIQEQGWPKKRAALLLAAAVLISGWPARGSEGFATYWSPYYHIDVFPMFADPEPGSGAKRQQLGVNVNVNQMFHSLFLGDQVMPKGLTAPKETTDLLISRKRYYSLPYTMGKETGDVLIMGAGPGQDVYEAIKHNAKSVDAVEIDPMIINLGKKYNPLYTAPQVNVVCDDARHFVNHSQKKYDLIILACLDSSALSGQASAVRLDCYIYTKESFANAIKLLKPDGVMVISFGAGGGQWLRNRMNATIADATGYPPLVYSDLGTVPNWPAYVFFTGPLVQKGLLHPDMQGTGFLAEDVSGEKGHYDRLLTDKWPYMYLAPASIDVPYLIVMCEALLLALIAGRKLFFAPRQAGSWEMFFLGAAFMLLELQAISRLSLIYGSTWLTSSIVINGVLIMILLANLLVIKLGGRLPVPKAALYGLLMVSLATSFALPELFTFTTTLGSFTLTLVTLLPVLIAGLIFATSFSVVGSAAQALAFNLFGSVVGSMLEYLSNYFGSSILVIIASILYALAFLSTLASKAGKGTAPVD